jgi:hypothetical protein
MEFEAGQKVRIKTQSDADVFFEGDDPLVVTRVNPTAGIVCVSRKDAPAKWVKAEELELISDR